jgi:hypothetical protein
MSNRRVVVTGIGTINPLGDNIAEYFANLEKGVSAAAPITSFDAHNFKTRFACEIKNYDWARYFDRKEVRKYDRYTQYAMIAVAEAMQDSALEVAEDEAERIGVVWSTGVGGLGSFFEEVMDYAAGDVVLYDGVLFRFKADHAKGAWDYNEVEEWSEKKEREKKLTELGQQVIYDVSKNNDGATFASLSALLSSENLSTLIPIVVRCGGMSIRFVQSSDNKYVQYFLTKNVWSTLITDWYKINVTDELDKIYRDLNSAVTLTPDSIPIPFTSTMCYGDIYSPLLKKVIR